MQRFPSLRSLDLLKNRNNTLIDMVFNWTCEVTGRREKFERPRFAQALCDVEIYDCLRDTWEVWLGGWSGEPP